ncbi:MliC family protein [Aliagarivorans marinus]|uniref:MliC family protein n=1 Tax=Aliagarivorans marinus TaxID=561965 RepID=UPI00041C6A07|nr:MliC family protein [Aliagarivorans marinus]
MVFRHLALPLSLTLFACSEQSHPPIAYVYRCAEVEEVSLSLSRDKYDKQQLELQYGNLQIQLKQVPAASGAKFSDGHYQWWEKGDKAVLLADNQLLLSQCEKVE